MQLALTLRTRDRLSRNCYARDARAPVNAIFLRLGCDNLMLRSPKMSVQPEAAKKNDEPLK